MAKWDKLCGGVQAILVFMLQLTVPASHLHPFLPFLSCSYLASPRPDFTSPHEHRAMTLFLTGYTVFVGGKFAGKWFTPATEEEHLLAVVIYPSVALQDDDRSEDVIRSCRTGAGKSDC